ncbi:MAG TPA: hypothetical protein VKA60_05495 [Blastocatellia bacterium]|nr:hypothetical protein [Blastocatellia bacterium]
MIKIGLGVMGSFAAGLILLLLIGSSPRLKDMSASRSKVQTSGLPEYGIEVIGPAEATFATLMSKRLQKVGGTDAETLKSSSIFVINNSQQAIAGLSVKWELFQSDGRSIIHRVTHMAGPKVVSDAGSAYFPAQVARGDRQLISLLDVFDDSNRNFRVNMGGGNVDKARQLAESVKVMVSVDTILFTDGTFVGPDTGKFFASLEAELRGINEVFAEMAQALKGDAGAMKHIEALANDERRTVQMRLGENSGNSQTVKGQYARILLGMRKKLGDEVTLERINAELSKPRINLRKL